MFLKNLTFKPYRKFEEQRLLGERTRTGEMQQVVAHVPRPTAQDALVDMEVVGYLIFAHRLIDTVLSRYPVAI
jgi:hypothetical protein